MSDNYLSSKIEKFHATREAIRVAKEQLAKAQNDFYNATQELADAMKMEGLSSTELHDLAKY